LTELRKSAVFSAEYEFEVP